MKLKLLSQTNVKNKTVLLKVDYNVPLTEKNGKYVVADSTRIERSLPTIHYLLENNCKIIITSHLGRPKGQIVEKFKLNPVAKTLGDLLEMPVKKLDYFVGDEVADEVKAMNNGEIIILENSRFHPGEKKNDLHLAKKLADLADIMVNDSFSSAHRSHATVVGVTKYIPVVAGLAFAKEVEMLSELIENPARPFVTVVGGAKISDKVEAVRNLSKISDVVLIGGGVANNFIKADGLEVYHSYLEEDGGDDKKKISFVAVAEELLEDTKAEKMMLHGYIPLSKILYPVDVVAAEEMENPKSVQNIDLTKNGEDVKIDPDVMFLDIGPNTRRLYRDIILQAKTIFWNGPMGVFEDPAFEEGTKDIARAIAKSPAKTILGGGDTIRSIHHFGLEDRYDYVSAAGGASLEFLSGKVLPGIEPMIDETV